MPDAEGAPTESTTSAMRPTPVSTAASNPDPMSQTSLEKGATASTRQPGFWSRAHLTGPVTKQYGDWPLLACCLATGLVDAAVFSNYAVFVGLQTGNTVILGLSTAGLPSTPYAWLTTLVSIASFLIGARIAFEASRLVTPRGIHTNRLWFATIFFIQALLIILSAALATPNGLIPQNPAPRSRNEHFPHWVVENVKIVSLIPPLGLQSGMQIAGSRLIGFNELPVNVLTSTYCDLMGDFKLFALNNVKRTRRLLAVIWLLVGAICAGWLMRTAGGLCSVLWTAGGLKLLVAGAILVFMPRAREEDEKALPVRA